MIIAALVLPVLLVGGGYWHRHRASVRPQAESRATAAIAASQPAATAPAVIATKPLDARELQALDGRAFIEALPDLERRARDGEPGVARTLFERLQGCVGFRWHSDAELREPIDEDYRHQRERNRRMQIEHPGVTVVPPGFPAAEELRDDALQHAFERRDRCSALQARQVDARLEWLRLALRQHDRQALLGVTGPYDLRMTGAELVRHADRLLELREFARTELDRLALGGDTTAMAREAIARAPHDTLWPHDPVQAWAWAWLQRRIDSGDDVLGMEWLMQRLASELTPEQLAQAQVQGEELLRRCCGKVAPGR